MEKETQEKIQQLQLIEQSLQSLLQQKQQFQSQLMDIDSATSELENASVSYKIVGSVMIQKDAKLITEELHKKKEIVQLRMKSVEKQEESVREKAKAIQEEVLETMKDEKNE